MAVQTDYPSTQPAAIAGAQATMVPATLISRNVETAAGIGFGKAVAQGAADKGVIAYAGTAAFLGIALLDRSAHTGDLFAKGESARVMTRGDVWVVAAVAVAAGDPVTLTAAGEFSNTGGTAVANARWDTSTTAAGQLAVVRLG
jgi:hypothetical protein